MFWFWFADLAIINLVEHQKLNRETVVFLSVKFLIDETGFPF